VHSGATVRVLDDNSRGSPRRLEDVANDIEFIAGDIRDASAVEAAAHGMDELHHLAFVNGTEFFYSQPELVLDVGVRGMVNVIDACRKQKVGKLILASSSEVYQTPPTVPTAEDAPLVVPDVLNPRYSYGAGKLISEVMAINFGRKYFERVLIFRPHNVYGPDMGWEHVVPHFALRLHALGKSQPSGRLRFEIQGSGAETRSFCFVDDLVAGVMRDKGEHLGIYHVGTGEEVTIAELARQIAHLAQREIELISGRLQAGGTVRRCPDISKLARLGYKPRVPLEQGLRSTLDWYWNNAQLAPKT
jgi:nucleoside-diphosphate-sugar epimerase